MFNVIQKTTGNILTLTIDLSGQGHTSRSGKSRVIASTEGDVSVEGKEEIKLGLNIYKLS